MKILVMGAGHTELGGGEAARVVEALVRGLRATPGVSAMRLVAVDRSQPALFKPGAHITAFDGRPGEFLFLSHDVDPWWHRNGEPLLVEAFADFLALTRPDVVHVHGLRLLGADLLTLARRVLPACRIVLTFDDYAPICAADGSMVRRTDGAPCDHASPVRCHQCFPDIDPAQFFLRRAGLLAHCAVADRVTVPRGVMAERLAAWGVPADRLAVVAHDADASDAAGAVPPAAMARAFLALYARPDGTQATAPASPVGRARRARAPVLSRRP